MAYVKSEKAIAEIEGRRALIIAAAIDIIKSDGMAAVTTNDVAARSGQSVGLIFRHFADMVELRAHVLSVLLARDLQLLRDAGSLAEGIRTLSRHLSRDVRITAACAADEAYRDGMRREIAKLIRATGAEGVPVLAAMTLGAILEASRGLRPGDHVALSRALLRAIGMRVGA